MNSNTNIDVTYSTGESSTLEHSQGIIEQTAELPHNECSSDNKTPTKQDAEEDYTIETFDVTKINLDLEDTLKHYRKKMLKSRARKYIKTSEVKREFTTDFSKVLEKRNSRKISFGTTDVRSFELDDVVPKRVLSSTAVKKSVLKDPKDKFVTCNHDYEIVGESELTLAIGRIYNLCDLPLTIFSTDTKLGGEETVITLKRLARGVANAFKTKEYCMNHVKDKTIRRKNIILRERNKHIRILKDEVQKLTGKLTELGHAPEEVSSLSDIGEDQEDSEDSFLEEDEELDMEEINEALEKELEEKVALEEILTSENDNLKVEVKNLKDSLLEQQNANETLLCQVRDLGEQLENESIKSIDYRNKTTSSLEKITRESLELKSKLQVAEEANKEMLLEKEGLYNWNEALYQRADDLGASIVDLQSSLTLSQLSHKRLEKTHQKVKEERDECHKEIKALKHTNYATKWGLELYIEQLQTKCDQLTEDCKVRDAQIHQFEYELVQMKKTLACSSGRMAKKRRETIIYFNTAPSVGDERSIDNWSEEKSQFDRGRQILKPIVNMIR